MNTYGIEESNPLFIDGLHSAGDIDAFWTERAEATQYMDIMELVAAKGRVTRVRILTEWTPSGRRADISYIWGVLPDGTPVSLNMNWPGTDYLHQIKGDFIAWGKERGFFAKGLGLLDEANWSVLK